MIPVDQTHLHDPPDSVGNCLAACVASILEREIGGVPCASTLDDEETWWFMYVGMLYVFCGVVPVEYRKPEEVPQGCYVVATGLSPRSPGAEDPVYHAVVWKDGEIVHDPHPSRDGLASDPVEFWELRAVG